MGRLLLVRHGKTEGPLHDRDRIGDTGRDEARRTARALAAGQRPITHAFTGPANRHAQTFAALADEYAKSANSLGNPVTVPTLDEYDAIAIFDHLLPRWLDAQGLARPDPGAPVPVDRAAYRVLEGVGTAWATGALSDPRVESWEAFRARCVAGLGTLTAVEGTGATVLCTTSAGTIAAIVGHVLGLDPARAFGLSLAVRNGSVTELRFDGRRAALQSFNVGPPP